MKQHGTQPPEREGSSREQPARSLPPANRRSAITGALAALLVVALGAVLFSSMGRQRIAQGAADGTPTTACTPEATTTATATASTPTAASTPAMEGAFGASTPTVASTPTPEETPPVTITPTPEETPPVTITPTVEGTPTMASTPTATNTPTPEETPTTAGTPAVACTPEARTPTAAPSPTVGESTTQAPKRGAGLPKGVEVIAFAPTGPDEGWGTGGVITDPVTGFPDRGMVLHYAGGTWTQVGATLSGVYLGGLDMVSSSEGWALGGNDSGKSLLLHIHNGTWQQAPLPADPGAAPAVMAMRTPGEGWLAMANLKTAYSGANTSLFHYTGGTWSLVRTSLHFITDIAPVADGEAWVIGWNTDGTSSLVHVRGGKVEVALTSPGNSSFSRLRMFAPNDIWIEGASHASSNADIDDVPLTYHFDGEAWANVSLHVPNGAQHVGIVASGTVWSFASVEPKAPLSQTAFGQIASIYSNASGQWRALGVPYTDLQSLTVVSKSSTDIWAVGVYMVTTQMPDHNGARSYSSNSHYVLLHDTGGGWTEYGR